jgi:hypothetical protein
LRARAQQCRHVATTTMTCKRHAVEWGGGQGRDLVTSATVTDFDVTSFKSFVICDLLVMY